MFQPDSRLIRFLTRICDLMILNILFLLSCMTVVFSGAGAVSLYTVTLRMFRGTEDSPGKSFLRSVRQNFALSFQAALLLLGDAALLAVLRGVLYADTLLLSPAVFVFLAIVAVFLTALLSYLVPPVTCLLTTVNLLPVLLPLFFPRLLGVTAAFWLFIGFAGGAWVNSFYLNRIFSEKK